MSLLSLLNAVAQWLWLPTALAQVAILFLMVRQKVREEFNFFFQFTLLQVLGNLALGALYRYQYFHPKAYATYFYLYWAISALNSFMGFAVIHEVFRNAFKPFVALRDFAAILFRWATLVLLVVAAVLAFTNSGNNSRLIVAILSVERSVLVMQAGMLLFLMLFASRLGLTWKHYGFGIALGFGLYACSQLTVSTLFSQLGAGFGQYYSLLQSLLYAMMVAIWVVYLASPEPARVAVESAFSPKPILTRWNQVLLRQEMHPEGAFMTNLERIVEQVMTDR